MMAALPFVVELTLNLPPDAGQELAPVQYRYSGTFNSLVEYKLELTGVGARLLDFGTISPAGAKLLLAKVALGTGAVPVAPVEFRINGGTAVEEVPAGGAKLLCAPAPVAGVTSLSVEHTADASVLVLVLG